MFPRHGRTEVLEFINTATLVSGRRTSDFYLESVVKHEEAELRDAVIERVKHTFDDHPFIVFMVPHDETLKASLRAICNDKHEPFVHIEGDEQALRERFAHNETRRGVFFVDRRYGRNYDLKLGSEALVLVVVQDSQALNAREAT